MSKAKSSKEYVLVKFSHEVVYSHLDGFAVFNKEEWERQKANFMEEFADLLDCELEDAESYIEFDIHGEYTSFSFKEAYKVAPCTKQQVDTLGELFGMGLCQYNELLCHGGFRAPSWFVEKIESVT